jgi:hypothetical protein
MLQKSLFHLLIHCTSIYYHVGINENRFGITLKKSYSVTNSSSSSSSSSGHCNNPEIYNYEKTTYGASINTITSKPTSLTSDGHSTNQYSNQRRAGLNSFQKNNCILAYRIHIIIQLLKNVSDELLHELKSSTTNMVRLSMWCTEEDIFTRSHMLTNGCKLLYQLQNQICSEFWSGLSYHFETMINQMHIEKYGGSTNGSRSSISSSPWILKMQTAMDVIETEDAVAWMLQAPASSTSTNKNDIIYNNEYNSKYNIRNISSEEEEDINLILRTVVVCRVLDSFCFHCSMIRPLSSGGREILLKDSKAIRSCMNRLIPVNDSNLYTELSAVEKYILLSSSTNTNNQNDELQLNDNSMNAFIENCIKSSTIRPSLCFHHIVSNGPPQLQLPHRRHGWSHGRYIVSHYLT